MKQQKDFHAIAVELALLAAGHSFPRLSQVGAGWVEGSDGPRRSEIYSLSEPSFSIATDTSSFGIFLLDTLVARDGRICLIEANGSNAALSSAISGRDDRRARHMYLTLRSRRWTDAPSVALIAYAPSLLHIGELYLRAGVFAQYLSEEFVVRLTNDRDHLGDEEISIVCGRIPDLADHITSDGRGIYYRGRPVVFGTNPNLLPELVRRGIIRRDGDSYNPPPDFQHEGAAAAIVHNKSWQQDLAQGTGFTPLRHAEAVSEHDAWEIIESFIADGMPVIGKINAGSGGVGIECFAPVNSVAERQRRLDNMLSTARERYGMNADDTIFPLRFFEFATSTPYTLRDGPRLWDFRFQCLVSPGRVEVTPCVIRLCPEAFDESTYDRGGVVANLTGRPPSLRYLRAPSSLRKSDPSVSVLDAMGIGQQRYYQMVESCARWSEAAYRGLA